jgi:hypothetical protein
MVRAVRRAMMILRVARAPRAMPAVVPGERVVELEAAVAEAVGVVALVVGVDVGGDVGVDEDVKEELLEVVDEDDVVAAKSVSW